MSQSKIVFKELSFYNFPFLGLTETNSIQVEKVILFTLKFSILVPVRQMIFFNYLL